MLVALQKMTGDIEVWIRKETCMMLELPGKINMCILQTFLKYIFKLIATSWKAKTR